MIMPSHAKNVKHYSEGLPLFARYQVESYLAGMFNPTVQLKSGGYIVIGVTEALVAIDVNSGRATKEGSIEETATKTNLEAAEEVARQLRLRDLAGLIVIDFIDMEERRNNAAVEKRIKDKLKTDRARIQVGRISGFGLMEMSRQRLRPGMIEATTQLCSHCHGTGLIRSDDNLALSILRQIEEEGVRHRSREVLLKAPVGIINFLMNQKREHIAQIEGRYGISVRLEADPFLVSPDFSLEKFKTATRSVAAPTAPVVSIDDSVIEPVEEAQEVEAPRAAEAEGETPQPRKRRRRRRRRRGGSGNGENASGETRTETPVRETADAGAQAGTETEQAQAVVAEESIQPAEGAEEATAKKPTSRSRTRRASTAAETEAGALSAQEGESAPQGTAEAETAPAKKVTRMRKSSTAKSAATKTTARKAPAKKATPRKAVAKEAAEAPAAAAQGAVEEVEAGEAPAKKTTTRKAAAKKALTRKAAAKKTAARAVEAPPAREEVTVSTASATETIAVPEPEAAPKPVAVSVPSKSLEQTAVVETETDKPKKRGWWSLGR